MGKVLDDWKVMAHGQLTEVDAGILMVVGELRMPLTELPRRMTVVRLADGRLIIWSAIALDEEEMQRLEEYGDPAFLIVPSDMHRMDARIWKDRYPELFVITPPGARKKVEEAVPVDSTEGDFGDGDVAFEVVPGLGGHEAALMVTRGPCTTLIVNDIIGNIPDRKGLGGWFLKLAGFAGDQPHIPGVVKHKIVEDEAALKAQLLRWADSPGLTRIIVSHGEIIDQSPGKVLRALADGLKG